MERCRVVGVGGRMKAKPSSTGILPHMDLAHMGGSFLSLAWPILGLLLRMAELSQYRSHRRGEGSAQASPISEGIRSLSSVVCREKALNRSGIGLLSSDKNTRLLGSGLETRMHNGFLQGSQKGSRRPGFEKSPDAPKTNTNMVVGINSCYCKGQVSTNQREWTCSFGQQPDEVE
jgi:hypothetical protein